MKIARRDQGEVKQLPVVVSARDLEGDGADIAEFIDGIELLSREFGSLKGRLFEEKDLESGRVTLLVDGLDEIADEALRRRVCERLRGISVQYPKCKMVVTTRPDPKTEQYFRRVGVKIYEIAPISWQQVRKIVKQVLENRSMSGSQLESAANGAQQVLRQIEEVHGFQLTPLMATVCAVSAEYSTSDVPANVTELFKKYSEVMLGRWDEHKGLRQQIRAPLKDFLLQKVALTMHIAGTVYMDREEFGNMVERLLAERGYRLETREIEDELLNRSRLLRVKGADVTFSHLLLQEFFAGRALAEGEIVVRVGDPWWTKAIVFHYGDRREHAAQLREVQESVARDGRVGAVSQRAIGLSVQASYLSLVGDRVHIWRDVIQEMAAFTSEVMGKTKGEGGYSLTEMTYAYLGLRDAVAFNALRDEEVRNAVLDSLRHEGERLEDPMLEATRFWVIVSLLESGLTREAQEVLKEWKFGDLRYCFWISMGAFFLESIVPVSEDQRRVAKKIREGYQDRIAPVTQEFLEEHRTLLLEKRGESIVEIPEA